MTTTYRMRSWSKHEQAEPAIMRAVQDTPNLFAALRALINLDLALNFAFFTFTWFADMISHLNYSSPDPIC
jgi:hypothetical protein